MIVESAQLTVRTEGRDATRSKNAASVLIFAEATSTAAPFSSFFSTAPPASRAMMLFASASVIGGNAGFDGLPQQQEPLQQKEEAEIEAETQNHSR